MVADLGFLGVAAFGDIADHHDCRQDERDWKTPDGKGHHQRWNRDLLEVEDQRGNQCEGRNDGNDDRQSRNNGHGF